MTEKRFMEFATQNTDNGEINNGFHDIKTGEWYYTKDSENAKKICELLNELCDENIQSQKELDKLKVVNEMLSMDFSNSEHELLRENEQLKDALNQRTDQCDKYYKENEQLKGLCKVLINELSENSIAFEISKNVKELLE